MNIGQLSWRGIQGNALRDHRARPMTQTDFASRFGFLVRDNYEDGLEWLLSEDNWKLWGEKGREYVSEYREHGAVIDRHMEIYRRLLG